VLIPLIVVLFLAVTERIGDYGITENRYAGIALGIWLVAQVLYFLFSKSKSIKFTVGSLCLLAFVVSFGPWGMLSVSQRSQVGRLSRLLTKTGVLVNSMVHKEHAKVSQEDAQEISSIVSYLDQNHGCEAIQPRFADKLKEDTKPGHAVIFLAPSKVLDKMGVEFIGYRRGAGGPAFSLFETSEAVNISGYDRLLRQQVVNGECSFDGEGISYGVSKDLISMNIMIGSPQTGFNAVQVNIAAFADQLLRDYGDTNAARNMKSEHMAIAAEQNGQKVKVFFRNLNVIRRDGKAIITSFAADIAYTERK